MPEVVVMTALDAAKTVGGKKWGLPGIEPRSPPIPFSERGLNNPKEASYHWTTDPMENRVKPMRVGWWR